eukprot:15482728-Alexandrium_andersonii.AAC.1
MTLPGLYRLGCKQALGYGGAQSTLAILELPSSADQVARAERVLNANLFAQSAVWYRGCYDFLNAYVCRLALSAQQGHVEFSASPVISFELHCIRGARAVSRDSALPVRMSIVHASRQATPAPH